MNLREKYSLLRILAFFSYKNGWLVTALYMFGLIINEKNVWSTSTIPETQTQDILVLFPFTGYFHSPTSIFIYATAGELWNLVWKGLNIKQDFTWVKKKKKKESKCYHLGWVFVPTNFQISEDRTIQQIIPCPKLGHGLKTRTIEQVNKNFYFAKST